MKSDIKVKYYEVDGIYHALFDGNMIEAESIEEMNSKVNESLSIQYGDNNFNTITNRVRPPKH